MGYNLYAARYLTLDVLYSAISVNVPMSQNGLFLPTARSFQFRGTSILDSPNPGNVLLCHQSPPIALCRILFYSFRFTETGRLK